MLDHIQSQMLMTGRI